MLNSSQLVLVFDLSISDSVVSAKTVLLQSEYCLLKSHIIDNIKSSCKIMIGIHFTFSLISFSFPFFNLSFLFNGLNFLQI